MSTQQEAILEKIRSLLAKAECQTITPEEAKLFSGKAQELMAKWAIDEAMLGAAKPETRGEVGVLDLWIPANEYRGPKIQLVMAIADANDCKLVMFSQVYRQTDEGRKRMFRMQIVGHEHDRAFVEQMYSSLLLQSAMELTRPEVLVAKEAACTHGGHGIAWRNSFMLGYAAEIGRRMKEAKQRAKADAETTYGAGNLAMVLVGKLALVERKFEELHPKLGKGKSSSAGSSHYGARSLGRESAGRADLGSPKVTSANRRQIV